MCSLYFQGILSSAIQLAHRRNSSQYYVLHIHDSLNIHVVLLPLWDMFRLGNVCLFVYITLIVIPFECYRHLYRNCTLVTMIPDVGCRVEIYLSTVEM